MPDRVEKVARAIALEVVDDLDMFLGVNGEAAFNALMDLSRKQAKAALAAAEAETQPVAWRVHDWADGWILFDNEARARHEADNSTGVIEPLFATAIRARGER